MRRGLPLLLLLLLAGQGAAQTVVLQDDAGDATATTATGAEVPTAAYDPAVADLLSLTILEHPDAFDFTLAVSSLESGGAGGNEIDEYFVDFQHGDTSFRLRYVRQVIANDESYYGEVSFYEGSRQSYLPIYDADLDVEPGNGLMTLSAPRDVFIDGNGTAPTLGRSFELLKAFSRSSADGLFASGLTVQAQDAMPDSGFSEVPYQIIQGLKQTGHARLSSDDPVRASNGEEATFVFYVQADNLDETEDRFDLTVRDLPDGWGITLPAATIRIDGNSSTSFPVIISTPFAHQHGVFQDFVLEMHSHHDSGSVGRLQLGIRYLQPPQPAGHHDRVWIHSREQTTPGISISLAGTDDAKVPFMSALEEDPRDQDIEVPPTYEDCCDQTSSYVWEVFLEPGLELGLDFDVNDTGEVSVEFTSDVPLSSASLSGTLVHIAGYDEDAGPFSGRRGEETVIAEIASTSPKAINGPVRFDSVITPKSSADLIPYQKDAGLLLRLQLTVDLISVPQTADTMPRLLPTGEMRLPLFEYRDPVKDVFNALAGLDLSHDDLAEKAVNPGETVLFNLTLSNDGAIDDVFDLRINGTNQDWGRILGDREIFVPTGGSRPIVIAVSAPKDALGGDIVDLIVTAASANEPTLQGNIRVVAVVDDLLDRTDEAYLLEDVEKSLSTDKKSPGPAPALLGLGLLGVALARSKRS